MRSSDFIFIVNYATLVDDPAKTDSLLVPFAMMKHGVSIDMTPTVYGGTGGIKVSDQFLPFEFDGEKLFFTITRPTKEDLHTLEAFELTSPYPPSHIRRLGKREVPGSIPLKEWQKRLALSPEGTVKRTFDATTQYYMQINC